jgi:DnaJ-class molecular chaperone
MKKLEVEKHIDDGEYEKELRRLGWCLSCQGYGQNMGDGSPCKACQGTGKITNEQS